MKKVIINKFGGPDVLEMMEVPSPIINDNEILVDVKAASVNPLDSKVRSGYLRAMVGENFPISLGVDFSGIVRAVGKATEGYRIGDHVYGALSVPDKMGAYSEQITASPESLARMPSTLDFVQAASIPIIAATAALTFTKYASLKADDGVLIIGASGSVGAFGIQFAKQHNLPVTASSSAKSLEFVKSLGADDVYDYRATKLADLNKTFDTVIDYSGTIKSRSMIVHLLEEGANLITAVSHPELVQDEQVQVIRTTAPSELLASFTKQFEQGLLQPIPITTFDFANVAEAHAHVDQGGNKAVIMVG